MSVAFLPGGRYLATSVIDGTARIWDTTLGAVADTPAVTLLTLPDGGYAALLPGGGYKLSGDAQGCLWWTAGLRRLAPGEADDYDSGIRRLPDDVPMLPPAR